MRTMILSTPQFTCRLYQFDVATKFEMSEYISPFHSTHPVMAAVQHYLGEIQLELEEFEEAQKHFQHSFATYKEVHGVKDVRTRQAHLCVAMAARLAGNLQHAKEILETTEDSFLGKAQPFN